MLILFRTPCGIVGVWLRSESRPVPKSLGGMSVGAWTLAVFLAFAVVAVLIWRTGLGGSHSTVPLTADYTSGLHPGVDCVLQGLDSKADLNGETCIIKEENDATKRRELIKKGRLKVSLSDPRHRNLCLSVKAANLTRQSKMVDPRLDAAVRADVAQGEEPMPMSAEVLAGVLSQAPRTAKYSACIRCHRCWREGQAGEPYCCLEGVLENGEILLECASCLVLAASEAGIHESDVTQFVDGRNMACMEAKSKLISDRLAFEDRGKVGVVA